MSEKKEIMAEEIVEKITQEISQGGEFALNNAIIKGKLNLRHRIIPVAVTLTNCTFTDEVDLRYCEFKECVDFSRSQFEKGYNSINTIYRKNLICDGAVFEDKVSFNSAQCEGGGHFNSTQFENPEWDVDFGHAIFKGSLICKLSIFKSGASFNSLQSRGYGFFCNARFENTEREIDFRHTTFKYNLEFQRAIFKGGATFNGLQCEGSGFFWNVQFENPDKEIDFGHARFGHNLDCQKAIFKGGASFNSLYCEGSGCFQKAQFENLVYINFVNARFEYLECQQTIFAGWMDFQNIQISTSILLWETEFRNRVNFNGATIHRLSLTDPITGHGSDSFPFEKDVDMRRCTFEIFDGTKEQQEHMVNAQSPEKFSQDPYLQFEQYYRSIGDEAYAKKVYYEGRRALRKNALNKENPEIRWSWWKKITDWVLCWTVGYGVRMWLALLWIFVFLCVGTAVFWSDSALAPKSTEGIGAIKSVVEQIVKGDEPEQTGVKDNLFTKLGHRLWYSLDLFIPIVNLRIVDGYKRFHGWRSVYGVVHIMMGWILVPLLIASLSGVVKKYS